MSVRAHSSELLVVDNGSSDDTVELIRAAAPGATVVELDRNIGFAAANNLAMERARGRYYALINSDAFPDRGAVDRLISRAEGSAKIGLVGGRLRDPSGRPQPSAGHFPSLRGNLGVALLLHRLPVVWRLPLTVSANAAAYSEAHRVDWVSGAFCLARPNVGPVPASGFMYGEDVEWARQAAERGLERWIEPSAKAIHLGGGGSQSVQAAIFRQRSRVDFELRWFGVRGRWSVTGARIVIAIHAICRIALFSVLLPLRPTVARMRIAEFRSLLADAFRRRERRA
jgi:N-acetylglucosaminyl-diphospho-decaprenol L-rhamnosyltransferase